MSGDLEAKGLKTKAAAEIETLIIDSRMRIRGAADAAAFVIALRSSVMVILEGLEMDLRLATDSEPVP